jgi:hypothetical protein
VHVSLAMWDISNVANARADVSFENVTHEGFDIVFRTWGDTRVASVRAAGVSVGQIGSDDT